MITPNVPQGIVHLYLVWSERGLDREGSFDIIFNATGSKNTLLKNTANLVATPGKFVSITFSGGII